MFPVLIVICFTFTCINRSNCIHLNNLHCTKQNVIHITDFMDKPIWCTVVSVIT